ncbi:cytochrome c-type biogenesis protein CcmH [Alteromonas sediminis]|uniref:Cytochrome c-type biogenesis protein n=1 Tax=Alteromonas sediminis TaxID=2259342 RepID=A0A3N5Y479_9ALTE|nr:cytochrome c-type biogenesis protein [Alteromonas sediminis]RPJ68280.1 cytochrome c-type biogenesis protein CcmH [Alteromonas sediminis]
MKTFFCAVVLTTIVLLSGGYAYAADDNYAFEDPKQRETFLRLTAELRCPMCQNQNIADSDAMIAHDMRRKVYQLMQQGKSEQEVIEFMRARYGDFVHYQPPVTPATSLLWLIPIGFVLIGGVAFIARRFYSPTDKQEQEGNDEAMALAEANRILEEEK